MRLLKNFLKKHFLILKIRNRFSPAVQIAQRQLYLDHKKRIEEGNPPALQETGFRVFSQFEEDGLLLFIFAAIGMGPKTFVDIGSDDGINSNCANLALNFGWHGLFIDASSSSIRRGRRFYAKYPHPWTYQPVFKQAFITAGNVNTIISDAGFAGDIDFLSIDIDGNDFWIWKAIDVIMPRVVIIETHAMFGEQDLVVPYKHPEAARISDYHGASPVAMVKLGQSKGYKLIGANELGFNFIFLKQGLADEVLPEIRVSDALGHRSVAESYRRFEKIRHLEYLKFEQAMEMPDTPR